MADLLLTECGFSQSQLSTLARRNASLFRTISTHRAQQAFQLLRDSGFTQNQVTQIIIKNPVVLQLKVDTQLKPKIEFMKTLGLTGQDLAHVLSREPRILTSSLDKNLSPKISLFLYLFGSKKNLVKAIKTAPNFLLCNIRNVEFLKQVGIQGELLLYLISRRPQVLTSSEESLKSSIEYVRNMGILGGSNTFLNTLMAVIGNRTELLDKKLKNLVSMGLLEEEIKEILGKLPDVLHCSIDKIQKNMEFLINTAGFPPQIVVKYPTFLLYSVEKRMEPRYKVLESLTAMQLSTNLVTVFKLGEQKFAQKFLQNPETVKLYENCKGKTDSLNLKTI